MKMNQDEILNFDFREFTNEQLDWFLFRCVAAKYWKNKGKMSVNQYVKVNQDFKSFREKLEKERGTPYEDKIIQKWISDMGPFAEFVVIGEGINKKLSPESKVE